MDYGAVNAQLIHNPNDSSNSWILTWQYVWTLDTLILKLIDPKTNSIITIDNQENFIKNVNG